MARRAKRGKDRSKVLCVSCGKMVWRTHIAHHNRVFHDKVACRYCKSLIPRFKFEEHLADHGAGFLPLKPMVIDRKALRSCKVCKLRVKMIHMEGHLRTEHSIPTLPETHDDDTACRSVWHVGSGQTKKDGSHSSPS